MIKLWKNFTDTYKIFVIMLVLILTIQLTSLLYIWTFKSAILLEQERSSLTYQLKENAERLSAYLNNLQKELEFLAVLEVMDDVLINDVDKRIATLLEKKAKDLDEGIILISYNANNIVSSSQEQYTTDDYLSFSAPIMASFNEKKRLGKLLLLYPYKNLMELEVDNIYQHLWLSSILIKNKENLFKEEEHIIVSELLKGKLKGCVLFLAHDKEDALMSIHEIENILFLGFILSLLLTLVVVSILSKKQMKILEHTQEVLALKRTFLSTMSHELRTPLGSILNLTQHLMTSPKQEDENILMLNKIESASEHLLSMINNLLQLSKLESNSMSVEKKSFDIVMVIEEIIEMLEPLMDEKGLVLKKDLLEEEFIISDINLFKQVIMNLLSNAIKFTHKGSIVIQLSKTKDGFVLRVKDTGIGIEKEKQVSLFSEFYQAHMGKEEIKHSTGLGLALSQKVAHIINGKISIKSEGEGKGCEAHFSFSSL